MEIDLEYRLDYQLHRRLHNPVLYSRDAALSEVMFTNVFKRATGLTPHAYLLDMRIKRARHDLISGNEKIAEIASRYHFKTARHFSTVFKRIIGTTPGQCRKLETHEG